MGDLTEQIVVRCDADMRDRLERQAAANERSVAQEVRYLIRQALDSHGTPSRPAGYDGPVFECSLPSNLTDERNNDG